MDEATKKLKPSQRPNTYAARAIAAMDVMREIIDFTADELDTWGETADVERIAADFTALTAVMEPVVFLLEVRKMMKLAGVTTIKPEGSPDAPTA